MSSKNRLLTRRGILVGLVTSCATPKVALAACQSCNILYDGQEPGLDQKASKLAAFEPKEPAAPVVSDSKRTAQQDVRYLNVVMPHSGQHHRVPFFVNGKYIDDTSSEINRILCDWRSGQTHDIKRGLLDIQWLLHQELGTDEPFQVLSAYRTPKTNAMLRRKSKGVARHSLHMKGEALDVHLKSRSVKQVSKAARALQLGGVGAYSANLFTHFDCGPVRSWGA